MTYVTKSGGDGASNPERGIFIETLETAADPDSLVLYRGEHAFVVMNLYPYNTGHMMVVPNRKVASLEDLEEREANELMQLLRLAMRAGRSVLRCDGFNAGLNVGAVAGAGVSDHLHFHLVPRWLGDANFMPITASTMVMPELLPATTARLKAEFATLDMQSRDPAARRTAGAFVYLPEQRKVVLRRARDGSIVLPKGRIEVGESAADAAIREVHEETGFGCTITGWCGTDIFGLEGKRYHAVMFFAVGEPTPDAADHLNTDVVLASPREAIERIAFDGLQRIARRGAALVEREFGPDPA